MASSTASLIRAITAISRTRGIRQGEDEGPACADVAAWVVHGLGDGEAVIFILCGVLRGTTLVVTRPPAQSIIANGVCGVLSQAFLSRTARPALASGRLQGAGRGELTGDWTWRAVKRLSG